MDDDDSEDESGSAKADSKPRSSGAANKENTLLHLDDSDDDTATEGADGAEDGGEMDVDMQVGLSRLQVDKSHHTLPKKCSFGSTGTHRRRA